MSTSLPDPSTGRPVFYIVVPGETQPEGPHPEYATVMDYNDTPPGFYRWNTTTEAWERVGELAP